MCRCPTRGEMSRAAAPPTGMMRRFSSRYGTNTTPWASGPGSGGSTVRLGAGSFSTLTTVLCAKAAPASRLVAAIAASVLMNSVIARSSFGKFLAFKRRSAIPPASFHRLDTTAVLLDAAGSRQPTQCASASTNLRHAVPALSTVEPQGAAMDMKLEVVVIPVTDVDRAKRFYGSLGWRLDADFAKGDDFRVVQFTPPGSQASIHFGKGVMPAGPGAAQNFYLVVSDIEAAR